MQCAILPKIMQYKKITILKWPLWAPTLPHQNFSDQIPAHFINKNHAMCFIGSFGIFFMVQIDIKVGQKCNISQICKNGHFCPTLMSICTIENWPNDPIKTMVWFFSTKCAGIWSDKFWSGNFGAHRGHFKILICSILHNFREYCT